MNALQNFDCRKIITPQSRNAAWQPLTNEGDA
jgi:hypothetical protein